jgi:hypothetical protein
MNFFHWIYHLTFWTYGTHLVDEDGQCCKVRVDEDPDDNKETRIQIPRQVKGGIPDPYYVTTPKSRIGIHFEMIRDPQHCCNETRMIGMTIGCTCARRWRQPRHSRQTAAHWPPASSSRSASLASPAVSGSGDKIRGGGDTDISGSGRVPAAAAEGGRKDEPAAERPPPASSASLPETTGVGSPPSASLITGEGDRGGGTGDAASSSAWSPPPSSSALAASAAAMTGDMGDERGDASPATGDGVATGGGETEPPAVVVAALSSSPAAGGSGVEAAALAESAGPPPAAVAAVACSMRPARIAATSELRSCTPLEAAAPDSSCSSLV